MICIKAAEKYEIKYSKFSVKILCIQKLRNAFCMMTDDNTTVFYNIGSF